MQRTRMGKVEIRPDVRARFQKVMQRAKDRERADFQKAASIPLTNVGYKNSNGPIVVKRRKRPAVEIALDEMMPQTFNDDSDIDVVRSVRKVHAED